MHRLRYLCTSDISTDLLPDTLFRHGVANGRLLANAATRVQVRGVVILGAPYTLSHTSLSRVTELKLRAHSYVTPFLAILGAVCGLR